MTGGEDLGEVYEADGRLHVRYVRQLAFPVERVWAALTVPERIADWLGDAEVDPMIGGRYHISSFRDDDTSGGWTIRRIEPPRLLEFASHEFASDELGAPTSVEIFELAPDGAGCVLTLTCSLEGSHGTMGGWHMFLDALPGAVVGVRAVWDEARHNRHETVKALYRAKLADNMTDDWMVGDNEKDGAVRRVGGIYELRLVRLIGRPVEKVWAALTIPERLADWIGEADVELRVGGRYDMRFRDPPEIMSGVITAFEPPRLLEYLWTDSQAGGSTVRWELTAETPGCRLVLTYAGIAPSHIIGLTSGWHDFLEMIPSAADGVRTDDVPRWEALQAHYERWLAPLIPGAEGRDPFTGEAKSANGG